MDFQVMIDAGPVVTVERQRGPKEALDQLLKNSRGYPECVNTNQLSTTTKKVQDRKRLYDWLSLGPRSPLGPLATSHLTGIYWIRLPNAPAEQAFTKEFQSDLTVMPMASMPGTFTKPMKIWYTMASKDFTIGVPRFWGLSMFGAPTQDHRVSRPYEGPTTFHGVLKDLQVQAIQQTRQCFDTWGGSTMIADCGFGKTATAIGLSTQIRQKTLILCNREILMDQWIESIQKFCGRTPVGFIQRWPYAKNTTYPDKTLSLPRPTDAGFDECLFTVGSIQSLSECEYPKDLYKTFGLVIVDEMHHIAAKSLVHVIPMFHAKYIFGLTATPQRSDGLEDVLYWLTGPVSFVYQRTPEVTGIRGSVIISQFRFTEGLQKEVIYKNGTLGIASMMTELSQDETRNEALQGLIRLALSKRIKVMVVVSHVLHGKSLFDANLVAPELQAIMCGPHQEPVKAKDPATRIVYATYSLLEEGYDDPNLDALVLAMPRSKIQQTIGRIERTAPGKKVPWVLDLVDEFCIFPAMSYKRKSFYKSRGFTIMQEPFLRHEVSTLDLSYVDS